MKKIFLLFLLFLFSCQLQEKNKNYYMGIAMSNDINQSDKVIIENNVNVNAKTYVVSIVVDDNEVINELQIELINSHWSYENNNLMEYNITKLDNLDDTIKKEIVFIETNAKQKKLSELLNIVNNTQINSNQLLLQTIEKAYQNKRLITTTINKYGVGIVANINNETNTINNGSLTIESDVTVALLAVDKKDKVVELNIDAITNTIKYYDNQLVDTTFNSKKELGNKYQLKKASWISKEWFEQIFFLENWSKNKEETKTVNQIIDTPTYSKKDKEKIPEDLELSTGVTIDINNYLNAIKMANNNLKSFDN